MNPWPLWAFFNIGETKMSNLEVWLSLITIYKTLKEMDKKERKDAVMAMAQIVEEIDQ